MEISYKINSSVFVRITLAMIKYHDPKKFGKERVHFHIKDHDQKYSKRSHGVHYFLAYSSWLALPDFLYNT